VEGTKFAVMITDGGGERGEKGRTKRKRHKSLGIRSGERYLLAKSAIESGASQRAPGKGEKMNWEEIRTKGGSRGQILIVGRLRNRCCKKGVAAGIFGGIGELRTREMAEDERAGFEGGDWRFTLV